jgi:hypothetical protein
MVGGKNGEREEEWMNKKITSLETTTRDYTR